MCLIIFHRGDTRLDDDRLYEAHMTNPDGFGIMFPFRGHRELFVFRGVHDFTVIRGFYNIAMQQNPDMVALHFRTASSGPIDPMLCHPFSLGEVSFMHNGNFPEFQGHRWFNDIQWFSHDVLQRLPEGFLMDGEVRDDLETYCRLSHSKMLFMDAERVYIVNEGAGEWIDGAWYSNGGIDNYLGYGYSGAYYYRAGDVRHPGGFPTPHLFGAKRRARWRRCAGCGGHFKKLATVGHCRNCSALVELRRHCI